MAGEQQLCPFCEETKADPDPRRLIEDLPASYICGECIDSQLKKAFERALKHEHHYPLQWACRRIDFERFKDLFTQGFVDQYRQKEMEYKTAIAVRIYCPHSILSGVENDDGTRRRVDAPNEHSSDGSIQTTTERCNTFIGAKQHPPVILTCDKCVGLVCSSCVAPLTGTTEHTCPSHTDRVAVNDPFAGLEKGVHYQICPYCGRHTEAEGGCNEMLCACLETFCYICGKGVPQAERRSHWRRPGCHRRGPLADATPAQYDTPDDENIALNSPPTPQIVRDFDADAPLLHEYRPEDEDWRIKIFGDALEVESTILQLRDEFRALDHVDPTEMASFNQFLTLMHAVRDLLGYLDMPTPMALLAELMELFRARLEVLDRGYEIPSPLIAAVIHEYRPQFNNRLGQIMQAYEALTDGYVASVDDSEVDRNHDDPDDGDNPDEDGDGDDDDDDDDGTETEEATDTEQSTPNHKLMSWRLTLKIIRTKTP